MRAGLFVVGLLAFSILPGRAETASSGSYVLEAGLVAGGAAGLFFLDKPMRTGAQDLRNGSIGKAIGRNLGVVGSGLNQLGMGFGGTVVPAAFYLGGIAARSETSRRVGVQAIEAYFAADTIAHGGKDLFGRPTPAAGPPNQLHLFSRGGSFPSSHAAGSFAVASVVANNYDEAWVRWTAYGIAGAVDVERVYVNGHWLSDVAAGTALGWFTGRTIARWSGLDSVNRRLYFGGNGIALRQKF